MGIIVNLLLSALAVFVSGRVIPGVTIDSFGTSILVAIILAVVNALVRPILLVLTLPVNIMTLGLFTFVINAIMIMIVDSLISGFGVVGFGTALIFSLVLSLVSAIIFAILG